MCKLIPNIQINNRRAQTYGVGETPLNRKGILLTDNAEDEEMVDSCLKNQDVLNLHIRICESYEYKEVLQNL